ncbi:MAG: hypothetical protein SNJ57_09250 [Cyanobacteriota bacterium]
MWHEMGRSRKTGVTRRVQLRLSEADAAIFDQYSVEQLSRIMAIALHSISPDSRLGMSIPTLVRPAAPLTHTIVRLQLWERLIRLLFPEKREEFRSVVRKLEYEWTGWCWQKAVPIDVDLVDRAAEVVNLLLLEGFCVQVQHTEIRDRAIAAQYNPESFRVVDVSRNQPYDCWFTFRYPRTDDLYDKLMRLTAAKYADGKVRVPPEHFAEVEDFAEQHDFTFTPAAQEVLEQYRALWEAAIIVQPSRKKKSKKTPNPLADKSAVIPDSLKDD